MSGMPDGLAVVHAEAAESPVHNRIEPAGLIEHFLAHPPLDFLIHDLGDPVPAFAAVFDLLTTTEPSLQRFIGSLPLSAYLRRLLTANACFVGTTASEYAVFPVATDAEDFAERLRARAKGNFPLIIVKDLPCDAVLVGEPAHAFSQALEAACRARGFLTLEGQALAYVAIDFASIDEFLARRSHARRKNLRRKLRSSSQLRIVEVQTGDVSLLDESLVARLYGLYRNVYEQSLIHFDLLTDSFFRAVFQDPSLGGILFLYYDADDLIAFNLCFCKESILIDKYIGFAYPQARDHNLYAVSWFHNLEYALRHGLRLYVAGWTDPEVKRELGAEFTFTRHLVYVRNPFLRALLKPLRRLFESDHRSMV